MELLALLLTAASAAVGLTLGTIAPPAVRGAALAIGLTALVLGLALLFLTAGGWLALGTSTAGLAAAVLVGAGLLLLPFGITASLRSQRSNRR